MERGLRTFFGMKRLAGVGVVLAITVGLSVWIGTQQASAGVASAHAREVGLLAPTERSSRLVLGRRVRCTATVSSNVQAGDAVTVRLILHNVAKRAVKYSRWLESGSVVLRAPDGTTYNPDALYTGLPGIPPPTPPGSVAELNAECSLSLDSEGSFLVAQVLVVTPPGLTGVQVFQPYETLWPNGQFVGLSSSPPYEAIAWAFVVTRDKAVPVAAASLTATNPSGHIVPFYEWSGSGWSQSGSYSCGGGSFSAGGRGPELDFISTCPS